MGCPVTIDFLCPLVRESERERVSTQRERERERGASDGFVVVAAGMMRRKPESSSISRSLSGTNYEVFLSFRGADTRKKFTAHLYSRLVDAGIGVFRDDENLPAGDEIDPQLVDAIKRSKISIAVLSRNYASSKSCLMEMAEMCRCRELDGQIIIPIFYDISPGDVKHQTGDVGRSFERHVQSGVEADTIKKWKESFKKIGDLKGFNRQNINGGDESKLVEQVLKRVWQVLKKDDRVVTDKLVGIDLHVQEVMRKLGLVYSDGQAIGVCEEDRRVVGICGLRGVGKTTLAKVVFNKIHMLFDGCCFLEDINQGEVKCSQEVLIASLQKRERKALNSSDDGIKNLESLFTNQKVLIVLDDVRDVNQIKALAGKLSWFGTGSRIIVTTYIREVLRGFEDAAAQEYEVKPMRHEHALQLFRKHAFQGDAPNEVSEYDSLSIEIVKAIGGLPLALKLQASYLSSERDNIDLWKETLEKVRGHPPDCVKPYFEVSFKSLNPQTKEIFLDIACFFNGELQGIPIYMWEACGYYPHGGIKSLRNLHLLEGKENNELRMHNMIRDFGRNIVDEKDPTKRCRFWNHSDALSVLADNTGTESVRGICLTFGENDPARLPRENFQQISNLRYLGLDRANIQGDTRDLLPNLRWLAWRACPLISELANMDLRKLVILNLSESPVTRDPQTWRQFVERVQNLKVLNLQKCNQLYASLDFPPSIKLERLILEDCSGLSQIGPSISNLQWLTSLNLKNCCGVQRLPQALYRMESLTELLIDGTNIQGIDCQEGSWKNLEVLSARYCKRLQNISTIGHLRKLSSLALDGADIEGLPLNFEFPPTLERLSLRECQNLRQLPPSIWKLEKLEFVDLSRTNIREMPPSVENWWKSFFQPDLRKLRLRELRTLKMAGTHLEKFPKEIAKLENLEEIDFSYCVSLGGKIRCDISRLSSLRILRLSSSDVAELPESICRLSCLQTLDVLNCPKLHALPKLPSSLLSLQWGSKRMAVPDLSYLTNLKELHLKDVEQPKGGPLVWLLNLIPPNMGWISRLPSLETLKLSLSKVTNLPRNFKELTQLRELSLSYTKELDLTQLPSTPILSTLCLKHCNIRNPDFSSLKYLSELELDNCTMEMINGFEHLKLLEVLKISGCNITDPNGLRKVDSLRKVKASTPDPDIRSVLLECKVELDACG